MASAYRLIRGIFAASLTLALAVGAASQDSGAGGCSGICSCLVLQKISLYGGDAAGLALDTEGNLYVANNVNNWGFGHNGPFVLKITPQGNKTVVVPPNILGDVTALALDLSGNLYVADGNGYGAGQPQPKNAVWKVTPDGNISLFISRINNPTGLALDSAQNLYVASYADKAVYKYSPAGVLIGTVASGFASQPYAIASDALGNFFVAGMGDGSGTQIYKIDPAGNVSVFVDAEPLTGPSGLAFDSSGNLYASYYNSLKILKIAPDGTFKAFPGGGIGNDAANGIAIDACGGLYAAVNGARTTNDPAVIRLSGIAAPGPDCRDKPSR